MASVSITGTLPVTIEFTGSIGEEAVARSEFTTTAPNDEVTFSCVVERNTLAVRIGATAGTQDILTEVQFSPGRHVFTITPGVSNYFVEWVYKGEAKAVLTDFQQVSAGDLTVPNPWGEDDLRSLR